MNNLQIATLLQALAQPIRLQLLEILSRGPICVYDLVMLTGKRQPYISQNLMALSKAGLVVSERDGRRIFYRSNPQKVDKALQALRLLSQPNPTGDMNLTCSNSRRVEKEAQ